MVNIKSRWTIIDKSSPSGKTLFQCGVCKRISQTPDKQCNGNCHEIKVYL